VSLRDYKLLTDENIDPAVIQFLRNNGFDVSDVKENRWYGKKDIDLMPIAFEEQRVIVTHDSDFGTIVFTRNEPFVGILYLRPGHFDALPHIQSLNAILGSKLSLLTPFILIAENTGSSVKIRLRQF
jgi:predicted nuclease of predicted toxin-antitoxin system